MLNNNIEKAKVEGAFKYPYIDDCVNQTVGSLQTKIEKRLDGLEEKASERFALPINYRSLENEVGYLHEVGDAGYDLFVEEDTWIFPFKSTKVPLDFALTIPEGYFGLLTSRSGTSLDGVFVIPGIIDSTYRGQLSAITTRFGLWPKKIKKGTRISQLIIIPYAEAVMQQGILNHSRRGTNGFGSTGLF